MPVVNTVYFDPAVGGTGLTVSDDGHPQFGLDNNGHRYRFVPALQNLVYIGGFVKTKALAMDAQVNTVMSTLNEALAARDAIVSQVNAADASALLAEQWASKITFPVADTRWSAREYANQAKSTADSMVNNIGLSRVDGGDAMTTIFATTIDGGGAASVFTGAINCGNAI